MDNIRGRSSVGRAPALQAGGRRFDPDRLHHKVVKPILSPEGAQAAPNKRKHENYGDLSFGLRF